MNNPSATEFAARVQRIQTSPTLAVAARAETLQAKGLDIINLSIGEPDFDTPSHIKQAAIQALHDGHTKYTAVDGIKSLKLAIIQKFAHENQLNYELNEILVSCGAKHSLYNFFSALLNPGDEVIIPAPYWVSYPDMVKLCDGVPIILPATLEQGFKITADQLSAALTPQTKLVILNSPSNPTGMAYTADELKALAEVLLPHTHIWIASDDIYEHHMWNHLPFTNILNVCPELRERCLIINGVSKTYAMTGWRIGYAAGPKDMIAAMKKAQSQSTSNPTSISQYAALAAISGDQQCVTDMTKVYKKRHDLVMAAFKTIPEFEYLPSDGTFYTFPRVTHVFNTKKEVSNDLELAEFLLQKAEIAVIPGTAFGAPGYIRLCYTISTERLTEGLARLQCALEELGE